jgi:hypothetical protein
VRFLRLCVEESHPMPVDSRPAMPTVPARQAAFKARRDWLIARLAACLTVLTAAIAVLVAAAAAVTVAIT